MNLKHVAAKNKQANQITSLLNVGNYPALKQGTSTRSWVIAFGNFPKRRTSNLNRAIEEYKRDTGGRKAAKIALHSPRHFFHSPQKVSVVHNNWFIFAFVSQGESIFFYAQEI